MSHYTRGEVTIKDPQCLVKALQELGFSPELHADPVQLYGFQGDARKELAHVVIPRAQVGGSSNDIGFYFTPEGKCEAIVSDYDSHRHGKTWLGQVAQLSGVHAALAKARMLGHRAERKIGENGRIYVELSGGRW